MKRTLLKSLLVLLGGVTFSLSASAETTTVGSTDNTSDWFTAFSEDYVLADNQKLYLEFTNYTSDYVQNTWKDYYNWAIIVKNDVEGHSISEKPNYYEYFGMNSANNSWGDCNVTENRYIKDYVWGENNHARMDGATVKMTVTRENGRVSIYALMSNTTQEGTEASETLKQWSESTFFDLPESAADKNIRIFLTVEKAHIVIDNEKTTTTPTTPNYYSVGTEDNNALFFSAFSDYYLVPANNTLKLHFKNYSKTEYNFQNWVAVVTNNKKRGVEGYSEYLVLRNDNYGWGTKYATETLTSNFEWGTNGTTFQSEMNGSDVVMTLSRKEADFEVYADITASDGVTKRWEKFVGTCDANEDLYFFLTLEKANLSIQSLVTTTISEYGWSTFCSDYALDFSKATTGLTAYTITDYEGDAVTLSEVTGTVPGGTPLLLKGTENTPYNIPIVGTSSTDVSTNKLVAGTGEAVSYASGKSTYVLGVNGTTNKAEFQQIVDGGTDATVAVGKAYLQFSNSLTARSLSLPQESTTGIRNWSAKTSADKTYYNLRGQRVSKLAKGLYIVGGKKVVK